MRAHAFVLVLFTFSLSASCETTRLSRIRPGMTRTDVAIELGRPAEVRVDKDATLWVYPASDSKVCTIKFVDQKVAPDPMKCDDTEPSRQTASKYAHRIPSMNSDLEYKGRVQRYCGIPPSSRPGCKISDECVNGGWEEICE